MADPMLESDVASYLSQPVTGERIPMAVALSPKLLALLPRLAAERGVPVEAFVEHLLFRQIRSDQARRMIGEKQEPVPGSFVDAKIAMAKLEVAKDVAAIKGMQEQGGDKATRIAAQMQAVLDDASEIDPEIEALNRRIAETDAKVDMALDKSADRNPKR